VTITCKTVEDFLKNISAEPREAVLQNVIHMDLCENPLDGDKRNAVKYSIVLQLSAVIDMEDGGQYLLLCGEDCGRDYRNSTHQMNGTQKAIELRERIDQFCAEHGLSLRPGVIGF